MAGLVPAISIIEAPLTMWKRRALIIEIAGTGPAMTFELRRSHRNMLWLEIARSSD
jgi:hypothetical protein